MTTQTHQPRSLEDIYDAPDAATETPPDTTDAAQTTGDQPAAEAAAAPATTTETAPAKEGAPPAPQTTEKPDGAWAPIKALEDERRKRQKAERELEEERRAKAEPNRGPDVPDPIVDPAGYANHIEQRNFTRLVTASRADMIDEVGEDDFATAEDAFKAAAAADPKLAERLWNSRDPARFAYNQGKKLIEQQATAAQASDPAAMRAQIKAELMAELGLAPAAAQPGAGQSAANRSAPAAPAAPRPAVPRSLAGARSAPPRKAETAKPARRSIEALYDA